MTLCSDLIQRTRHHLNSGMFEQQNLLASSITNSTNSLTFTYELGPIQEGAVLAVGLELMLVWEVTSSTGKTVSVQRGYAGSTAVSHTTTELVSVNPRFSDFHILQALNDDLASLSAHGLYQVKALTFTFDGTARTYNLASDVIEVLEVRYDANTSQNQWPLIDDYQVLHSMPTAEFASGKAIRLDGHAEQQRDVRVRYKAPFTALATAADDVLTVTGLHAEAHDLPPLGAAIMLSNTREVRRTDTFAQGDTRRANEVPPGMVQAASTKLERHRQFRIAQEHGRLYAQWPLRRRRLA